MIGHIAAFYVGGLVGVLMMAAIVRRDFRDPWAIIPGAMLWPLMLPLIPMIRAFWRMIDEDRLASAVEASRGDEPEGA